MHSKMKSGGFLMAGLTVLLLLGVVWDQTLTNNAFAAEKIVWRSSFS